MNLKVVFLLFILSSTTISAQNPIDYYVLARDLTSLAKVYKEEKSPNKIVIVYNTYKLVREKVLDKNKLKEFDNFFQQLIIDYPTAFDSFIISMSSNPILAQGPSIGSSSYEIEKIKRIMDLGITPDKINIEGYGSLNNINIDKIQRIKK